MPQKSAGGQPDPAQTASMIHGALMAGVLLFLVVAWWLPAGRTPAAQPLRVVLPLIALASFLGAALLRRRLPPRQAGEAPAAWWSRSLPRAVLVWALLEMPCLLAGMVLLMTGDRAALLWAGIGLLLFVLMTPARLIESPGGAR